MKTKGKKPVLNRVLPLVIGVRNPYALADALSRGKTRGWTMRDADTNKALLKDYLRLPYNRLFDPAFGSFLFGGKIREIVQSHPEVMEAKMNLGAPKGCSQEDWLWGTPAGVQWFYEINSAGIPSTNKPSFDDPQQGCIPDCYFLAVLGSLAWKQTYISSSANPITFLPTEGKPRSFGIKKTAPRGVVNYSTITWDLPLDTSREPAIAKSNDKSEVWVSVYEKAYACYLEATKAGKFVSDHPDIPGSIREGDPGATFTLLTGHKASSHRNLDVAVGYNSTADYVGTILEKMCQSGTTAPGKMINYPAVAYTYCTSDPLELRRLGFPLKVIPDCAAPVNSGVLYDNDLLVAAHAYSLLGIYTVVIDGVDQHYVILRNPYGMNCGSCGVTAKVGLLDFRYLEIDTIKYPEPPATGAPLPTVNLYNGVFALTLDAFVTWFMGFCWITP